MKFLAKIEQDMFASDPQYQTMGAWIYYTAAIIGAIIGLLAVGDSFTAGDAAVSPVTIIMLTTMALTLCAFAVTDSVVRIDNGKTAAKKAVYNCLAIIVAMAVGAAISVVVLIVIALLLIYFFAVALLQGGSSGGRKKRKLVDESGSEHEVSGGFGDTVYTSDGQTWRKESGNTYVRED